MERTIEELDRRFAIEGAAHIVTGKGGLPKVSLSTDTTEGEMYLHGAHVTSWKPAGAEEVIFVSKHAQWHEGIAIRGGVPICFPWFRAKADDPKAPAHGFVRTKAWTLESITAEGDSVTVVMSTVSDDDTRRWWPADFKLLHRVTFGAALRLELVVTNNGTAPIHFEEALHTYHKVGHVKDVRVHGLDGVVYLDNTDSNREKSQQGDLVIARRTDNAYLNTQGAIELEDGELKRRIQLAKGNSFTTVVWNPWRDGAKSLADLAKDEWQKMVCIEASNVLGCAVELAPGQQHTMQATIQVADTQ
jgi:glucose-6-phosphate 1-epimerase